MCGPVHLSKLHETTTTASGTEQTYTKGKARYERKADLVHAYASEQEALLQSVLY